MTLEELKDRLLEHAGEFILTEESKAIRHPEKFDADGFEACPLLIAFDTLVSCNGEAKDLAVSKGMTGRDAEIVMITTDYSLNEPKYDEARELFDPKLRRWLKRVLVKGEVP